MDDVDKGKYILSIAKSLKPFRLGDAKIAALLYASSLAGRCGLFASALRHAGVVQFGPLAMLAAEEGIDPINLRDTVLPWLEEAGLTRTTRSPDGQTTSVESLVLTYDGILRAVSALYDGLAPTQEDLGCLYTLELASQMPQPESSVVHQVAAAIGEEKARTAVQLAKGYRIVAHRTGKGLSEPILYSERLWARHIGRAAVALGSLDNTQRALVLEMVDRVRRYQGTPETLLRKFASDNNADNLLDLTIGVGLLNRTDIQMADGASRSFLTSPHFYGDLADQYGEDMFDRVKIFLDSIRNGQHFGNPWTGRIGSPEALLTKLLNYGEIGPCTAIGRDYVMSEKAGIVRVRRQGPSSAQHYMQVVQRDTVAKVLEVVRAGAIEDQPPAMEPAHVTDGSRFRSIEEHRAEIGDVPEAVAEAERAIILKLREGYNG